MNQASKRRLFAPSRFVAFADAVAAMLKSMFGLSPTVTAIILTIVLVVVALAYMLFGWLRKRSWRVMLRGVGFVLIPLGLLSMGLMTMLVNGIQAIVDWANITVMSFLIMLGLIVAGIGLVAYLIGSFVPQVVGDEANKRREAIRARKLAALQSVNQAPSAMSASPRGVAPAPVPGGAPAPVPAVAPASSPAVAPLTDDDKEVDDILRRHGIN